MKLLKQFFSRAPSPVPDPVSERRDPTFMVPAWMQGKPQWSEWDSEKAITEGYQSSPWVYACIKRRVDAVCSVPWVVEVKRGGEWERDDAHELNRLLQDPNPEMDWQELMSLMVTHLDLAGNGFWHKVRVQGKVRELWPLMPQAVKVIPGRSQIIEAYQIGSAPGTRIEAADITHMAYTNPNSLLYGQSPLMAVGKAVDVDNSAAAWQKISMQNRGVPDGIFQLDQDDLTKEQFDQTRDVVRENYANMGNARSPWVVNKAKWIPMSLTPAEVDFIETRHLSMKEICAAYAVPSEMISGMGDANRASSETVRKTFWLDTVLPLLSEIQSTLNKSLAREYGSANEIRISYDTSGVPALQESQREQVEIARTLWGMGVPFNEINQRLELGFDEIEGGEIGYLPSGLLPTNFDFSFDEPEPEGEDLKALIEKAYGTQNRIE